MHRASANTKQAEVDTNSHVSDETRRGNGSVLPSGLWRPKSRGAWNGDLRPFLGHTCDRVDATPDTPPIIICPGFGNSQEDYLSPGGAQNMGLVGCLKARGFKVEVMPVRRRDWIKALRSFTTPAYWKGTCTVDPSYGWFLACMKASVDSARLKYGSDQVTLLAHSAGGWLARAFLGADRHFDSREEMASGTAHNRAIKGLVTLGSPHVAPPASARDMTGGALSWVNTTWPGAYFREAGVGYACIAGCAVRGNGRAKRRELSRYSYSAYTQVCGAGHLVAGDGVVPNRSSFLQGAHNVLLEGVHHSMGRLSEADVAAAPGQVATPGLPIRPGQVLTPEQAMSQARPSRPWYGSEAVVDAWAAHLL